MALCEVPGWRILEGHFVRSLRSSLLYQEWPLGIKYPIVYTVDRDLCCSSVLSSSSYTIQGESRLWKQRLYRVCRYSEIWRVDIYSNFAMQNFFRLHHNFLFKKILNNLLRSKSMLSSYLNYLCFITPNPWCFNPVKNLTSLFSWFD